MVGDWLNNPGSVRQLEGSIIAFALLHEFTLNHKSSQQVPTVGHGLPLIMEGCDSIGLSPEGSSKCLASNTVLTLCDNVHFGRNPFSEIALLNGYVASSRKNHYQRECLRLRGQSLA